MGVEEKTLKLYNLSDKHLKSYKNPSGYYSQIAQEFKDGNKDYEQLRQFVATMGRN